MAEKSVTDRTHLFTTDTTEGGTVTKTPGDVLSLVKDEGYEFIDLRFCDLPGQVQHFTVPVRELTEDSFEAGFGFDGSSIRGFQQIQESDMLLIPDPTTAVDDVFRDRKTLILYCFVNDPVTGAPYDRDPRYVAKKAEEYLKSTGIAETSYWGPEVEFYIFDDVRYGQNQYSGFYYVDSIEGSWNTGEYEEGGNLGHKPRYKEGYFPVPPTDHFQDLRSEMTANLEVAGINIEVQHHEVGTAGQAEIDMRYDTLLRAADNVTLYKYIVKNTAWADGRTVTFMPKPIFEDNGSGMHTHQSLWNGDTPLFFDEAGYAGLSDMARWYIGGLLKHAAPILAFAAPTTNSYHRRSTWCIRAGTARRRSASRSTHRHLGRSDSSSAARIRPATRICRLRPCCSPVWMGCRTGSSPMTRWTRTSTTCPRPSSPVCPRFRGASPRRSRLSRTTTSSCWRAGCSPRS
jgi:glutamine synthetase